MLPLYFLGKSTYVKRCQEKLCNNYGYEVAWSSSTIRLLEKNVNVDDAVDILTNGGDKNVKNADPHFVHVDITPAVSLHMFMLFLKE